ncbi:hypothetical protein Cni_G15914 [Canna indica]|uniref:Uncharacterized protein n=1 Tax=Canna indica TaxID=4628 RepID=A0AAQ3QC44_9LILI|nr:hypothetical protein Cni_G15914 [Canna indica]
MVRRSSRLQRVRGLGEGCLQRAQARKAASYGDCEARSLVTANIAISSSQVGSMFDHLGLLDVSMVDISSPLRRLRKKIEGMGFAVSAPLSGVSKEFEGLSEPLEVVSA